MAKGRIEVNAELCKGCDFCVIFCPQKVIKISGEQNSTGYFYAVQADPDGKCNACKVCGIVCPEAAIDVFKICDCENCDCGKEDKK